MITPRGLTPLSTQEEEYSFSGFIPTNKKTSKQCPGGRVTVS